MTRAALILLLGAALAGTAPSADASAALRPSKAHAEPATLYRCERRIPNPGGHQGFLTFEKAFREDGSVQSFTVHLEDQGGSFIPRQSPYDQASARLRWPGGSRIRDRTEFNWADGSIDIYFHSERSNRFRILPKERWRQVVVDRNRSVIVHETDGMRTLFLSGLDMRLVSELTPVSSPGRLEMSLDGLMAWGSGVERLTVYETLVTGLPYDRRNPGPPAGRRRVVSEYEIDVATLIRKVEQVREEARQWEAGLADFRKACERGVEQSDDIIVT